jgi:hypothetical protein
MDSTESKKLTKLIISMGIILLITQVAGYLLLTSRIQDGEQRIYTDLHTARMDIIRLKEGE